MTLATWTQLCGSIGLAYVAGFLAFMLPSGVGVREYFLSRLLSFAGPHKGIAAAVLLLRLVWTTSELILAGIAFFLRNRVGANGCTESDERDRIRREEGQKGVKPS